MKTIALCALLFVCCSTYVSAQGNDSTINTVDYSQDIIYQIVTDRFNDGDSSNNPTGEIFSSNCIDLHKYCGGDWKGITDKINDGYFTNMGITALWISQPVENVHALHPSGYTSYHGYWARDYKRTNPYYGNSTDFDSLIETAHSNGIKIIMDFTPNHSSPALETDPNYAENGAIYDNGNLLANYSNDPLSIFLHNGGTDFSTYEDSIYRNLYDLADYNLNNSQVDRYLKESIKLWLDKGIDGIRVDAVKHMPQGWQKSLMSEIYTHKPVFTFGEWFLGQGEVDEKNHHFANESGMSLLDFRYGQKIREVLKDGTDNWYGFNEMIQETENDYDQVIDQVTFIDNHDMSRFSTDESTKRNTDMALAVLLTSRGVPTIYYGTEQYLTGNNDPENRKPMPAFDTETTSYKVISSLAELRKSNLAVGYGDTTERWINSDVYIYERKFGDSVVVTAINKGTSDYPISNLFTTLPAGQYQDVMNNILDGNEISVNSTGAVNTFTLSAKSAAVWEYTKEETKPLIGHVGPMEGSPGNLITVNGEGFGSETGKLKIGTANVLIESWSNEEIKFKVPDIASGNYDISLNTADGLSSNVYEDFEVLTGKQVSVRFVVNNALTDFGEDLYLTGNVGELGNWDVNKAIGPMFNQVLYQYPTWYYDVSVPAGEEIQFKFFKKKENGVIEWESGSNHTYTPPEKGTDTIIVDWN